MLDGVDAVPVEVVLDGDVPDPVEQRLAHEGHGLVEVCQAGKATRLHLTTAPVTTVKHSSMH